MPDVKSFPTAGYDYIVKSGDYLRALAQRAYGDEMLWKRIQNANPSVIANGDLIYPGDRIYIPGKPLDENAQKSAAALFARSDPETFNLTIGSRTVPVICGRVQRSLDTIYDTWTATIAWEPGADPEIDKLTEFHTFSPSTILLGSHLVGTGKLYKVKKKQTLSGSTKDLTFNTATVDLVDSKMPINWSLEWWDVTLGQVAADLLGNLGYRYKFLTNPPGIFPEVVIEKVESYGAFLIRLAGQRSVLLTSDEYGAVIFLKPSSTSKPVGIIEEAEPGPAEWECEFDARECFHSYSVVGQSGDADDPINSTAVDPNTPSSRTMTYIGEDVDAGSVGNNAAWRRSKQIVKALSLPFTVPGWYAPNGELWEPGQIVTVRSRFLGIPGGFNFLIKQTEHVFEEAGLSTTLQLLPPQTFTGEEVKEPWLS